MKSGQQKLQNRNEFVVSRCSPWMEASNEGGELFDRIVAKGQYSERQAAELIKTIIGVVQACHSLGVMHRDLKPENLLFDTPKEEAKLKATDFGLSVFYKPVQHFSDGIGSPYYVAHEAWKRGLEKHITKLCELKDTNSIGKPCSKVYKPHHC